MSYDIHCRKYREYQAMQVRRGDALRWGSGSTFLLSGALSLLFIAFVFYDQPITNNAQNLLLSARRHRFDRISESHSAALGSLQDTPRIHAKP